MLKVKGVESRTVSAPDVRRSAAPATVVHTSAVMPCRSAGLPLSSDMFSVKVYLQQKQQGQLCTLYGCGSPGVAAVAYNGALQGAKSHPVPRLGEL